MWIISKSFVKKLLDVLNGNFSNIEEQLTLNREVKVHTARRLIYLKKNLEQYNKQVHQEYDLLYNSDNKNDRLQLYKDIKRTEISLITYISTWSINVKQNVIKASTVKKCLGPVLYQEDVLLNVVLENLLIQKHSNYVDALNCRWMFNNCATLINKGGN